MVGTYVIGTDVGVELGSVPEPTEQPEIKQTTAKNRAIAALKQLGQEDFFCIKQNSRIFILWSSVFLNSLLFAFIKLFKPLFIAFLL